MDEINPKDVPKFIALRAFNSLRPSERKALILWVCKKVPLPEETGVMLRQNGFINGPKGRVPVWIRAKCRLYHELGVV